MNKKIVTGIKTLALSTLIAGIASTGFDIKETKATLTGPSGKCGFSGYSNMAGMNARVSNWSSVTTMSNGVIDFDARKGSWTDVVVAGYGTANAQTSSDSGVSEFEIAQTSVAGLYQLTFPSGSKLNLVSTNSGNTYLMQGQASSDDNGPMFIAVCQAL